MAQTPNTNPQSLDRENLEAIQQSSTQQWTVLRHLLHLPSIDDLPNTGTTRVVAERLEEFINRVRGGILNSAALRAELIANFDQQIDTTINSFQNTSLSRRGTNIAEAWLRVIYRHLREEDVRGMINLIPPAIRRLDGTRRWAGHIRSTGGIWDFEIDLDHPAWKSGNEQQIRARLDGRLPAEVGINLQPIAPTTGPVSVGALDSTLIDEIFKTKNDIINPRVSLSDVRIAEIAPGQTAFINMADLLRLDSAVAGMTAADMIAHFTGTGAPRYNATVTFLDAAGFRIATPTVTPTILVPRLFEYFNRPQDQQFGSLNTTLTDAIVRRQPMESLLTGAADNRELMLALATMQRDPIAGEVLNASAAEGAKLREDLEANNRMLNAATALKTLRELGSPKYTGRQVRDGIRAMDYVVQNLSAGAGAPNGAVVNMHSGEVRDSSGTLIASGRALNSREVRMANLARLPISITRIVVTNARTGSIERDNSEQFQKVSEQASKMQQAFEEESVRIDKIEAALNSIGILLQDREITNPAVQLPAASYPLLYAHIDITGASPFRAIRNNISTRMNFTQIEQEFRRALLQANPKKSLTLQNEESYQKKNEELQKKLEDSAKSSSVPTGSEACWAVIQRGLENQGMRGAELENTMNYMRAQVQRTNESVRDRQALTMAQFPYSGEHNELARDHYNDHNHDRFRGITNLFRKEDVYGRYLNYLFNNHAIGLRLNDNPHERRFALSRLVDAYFRTQYLMQLPSSNHLHLPESNQIISFMRRLHEAILDRSQESFSYASGMTQAEFDLKRAETLGVDPKKLPAMTMTERMQATQDMLNSSKEYFEKNRETIEKIANHAYHPIHQAKEDHDKAMHRLIHWPKNVLWTYTTGWALNKVWKYGVKPVWNNKGPIAKHTAAAVAGGVLGTMSGVVPLGTYAGAAAGIAAYRALRASAGGGGHSQASHGH